jgi:hypothetical protein
MEDFVKEIPDIDLSKMTIKEVIEKLKTSTTNVNMKLYNYIINNLPLRARMEQYRALILRECKEINDVVFELNNDGIITGYIVPKDLDRKNEIAEKLNKM